MIIENGRIGNVKIAEEVLISGEKLVVTGRISVESAGCLVLENCAVLFESGSNIFSEGVLKFSNSTFAPASSDGSWNGITLSGEKTSGSFFENCKFDRARADDDEEHDGGALTFRYTETSVQITVKNCTFNNCEGNCGGGINVTGLIQPGEQEAPAAAVLIENCRFDSCRATCGGALALIHRGGAEISGCSFERCQANSGGGVYLYDHSMLKSRCSSFNNCRATIAGGALTARFSTVELSASKVENCRGDDDNTQGGGYYLEKSNSRITGESYSECHAQAGGAIRPVGGIFKLEKSQFANCSAAVAGGAIAYSRDCESKITGCSFKGCRVISPTGTGNVIAFMNTSAEVDSCVFDDCQTGEISREVSFKDDSEVNMRNCQWPKKTPWNFITSLFKSGS